MIKTDNYNHAAGLPSVDELSLSTSATLPARLEFEEKSGQLVRFMSMTGR